MGYKRKTYKEIKEYVESENWKLITTEKEFIENRMTTHSLFSMVCNNGHNIIKSYHNFINKKSRCSICFKNIKRSYEEIKEYFEKNNYSLMTSKEEFVQNKMNSMSKYNVICENNHNINICFDSFFGKKHTRCIICSGKNPKTYNDIKTKFEKYNYKLITPEKLFINKKMNAKSKYDIICPNGHTISMCYNNFSNGSRCRICAYINNSGKNNPNYNPNKKEYDIFCNPIKISLESMKILKIKSTYLRKSEKLNGYTKKEYDNVIGEYNTDIYDLDHKFPKYSFWEYGLTNKKYIKIINGFDNLELIEKSQNYSKGCKYNDNDFFKFLEKNNINLLKELIPINLEKRAILDEYIISSM